MKLLICDLDGTLLDTLSDITTALNLTLRKYNTSLQIDDVFAMIGNGARKLLLRAVEKAGITDFDDGALLEQYMQNYLDGICIDTRFYMGVQETLTYAKQKGMTIVVATMKPKLHTDALLKNMGIAHYFDDIMSREDMELPKPDPWCVYHFAQKYGVHTKDIIYVGDSLNDTKCALAAGVTCIAVTYGYCDKSAIQNSGAHYIIDDFSEILKII